MIVHKSFIFLFIFHRLKFDLTVSARKCARSGFISGNNLYIDLVKGIKSKAYVFTNFKDVIYLINSLCLLLRALMKRNSKRKSMKEMAIDGKRFFFLDTENLFLLLLLLLFLLFLLLSFANYEDVSFLFLSLSVAYYAINIADAPVQSLQASKSPICMQTFIAICNGRE